MAQNNKVYTVISSSYCADEGIIADVIVCSTLEEANKEFNNKVKTLENDYGKGEVGSPLGTCLREVFYASSDAEYTLAILEREVK